MESINFLTYLLNTWDNFSPKLISYSIPDQRDIDDSFKVMGSKSRSQKTFSKNALYRRRHNDRRFAVEDLLVRVGVTFFTRGAVAVLVNEFIITGNSGQMAAAITPVSKVAKLNHTGDYRTSQSNLHCLTLHIDYNTV